MGRGGGVEGRSPLSATGRRGPRRTFDLALAMWASHWMDDSVFRWASALTSLDLNAHAAIEQDPSSSTR